MQISIDRAAIAYIIDPLEKKTLGTGFHFLRKDWILTAKHVVMDGLQPRAILLATYPNDIGGISLGGRGFGCQCDVVWTHPELDLAILAVPPEAHEVRPLLPGHHSLAGTKGFYYVGYSPSNSGPGVMAMTVGHTTEFTIERRERSTIEETVIFDAPTAEGGNSGGPLLGEGAAVLGVIIERFVMDGGATRCRATSIAPILDALTMEGMTEPVFVPMNLQTAEVPRWKADRRPRGPDSPAGDAPDSREPEPDA